MSGHRIVLVNSWHFDKARQMIDRCQKSDRLWQVFFTTTQKRTPDQNANYWGILHQIANGIGESPLVLHERYKTMFLGIEDIRDFEVRAFSSACEDPPEFRAYLDRVVAHGVSDLGLEIDRTYIKGNK